MSRTLAAIQADLDLAYAARAKALEAESYTLDSGQGRRSVTRNLQNIEKTIRTLKDEYAEAESEASGDGVISMTYRRNI